MTMMLDILLIAEREQVFSQIEGLLAGPTQRQYKLQWVSSHDEALRCFREGHHDLYLVDYESIKDCLELLNNVHQSGRRYVPIVFVADCDTQVIHSGVLEKSGALEKKVADCLPKTDLTTALLERSIQMAVQQRVDKAQLLKLAHYDSLTGLANRELFRIGLMEEIIHSRRSRRQSAVILIDLDNFKDINDSMGHPAGDELLAAVADRLRRSMRETDVVARLGGDEFALVATQLASIDNISSLCGTILSLFDRPFEVVGRDVMIAASVGVSVFPSDSSDPDELLRQADLALYKSKDEGRNCYHFFDQALENDLKSRQMMQEDLRDALVKGRFFLVYQPIVNVETLRVEGVEALLRCYDRNNELMSPEEFIPVAESVGLIFPIGDWVIKQVFQDMLDWAKRGLPQFAVAINVSAIQLRNDKIVQLIRHQLTDSGINPALIHLELTESMLLQDNADILARLQRVSDLGIKISIDDFGTGYSSLAYLKKFPVDIIKIDKSLTQGAVNHRQDAAITTAVISISEAFDAVVIAEGVEEPEHHQFLREQGCDLMQGYHISYPLDSEGLLEWYSSRYPNLLAKALRR